MFLDSELREIQVAKERLVTRCALRRQLVRVEVLTAWAALRRKLSYASIAATLGVSIGLQVFELVRGRAGKKSGG